MGNPVVHFEVLGQDAGSLRKFYSAAFGWSLRDVTEEGSFEYAIVTTGEGIEGGIGQDPEGKGHITFYVGVDSVTDALAKVEQLGGRTVQPPTQTPGPLVALFADPEGHVMGLLQERAGS